MESAQKPKSLPHLPRPIFVSYSRRDFRLAYFTARQFLNSEELQSSHKHILMDFPVLLPPDLKFDFIQINVSSTDHPLSIGTGYEDNWASDMPGWMYAIGQNLKQCNSVVVIVTPNSKKSKAVETELKACEAFPEKPVTFVSLNGSPLPDLFNRFENAKIHDLTVDIKSLMGNVLASAFDAKDKKNWFETGVLFTEALQMMPIYPEPSRELTRDILLNRGLADTHLGYRDPAVRMYQQALNLVEPNNLLLQVKVIFNLAQAYALQDNKEVGRDPSKLELACDLWRKALAITDTIDSNETHEDLALTIRNCQDNLNKYSKMLENADQRLIPVLIQSAGLAEQKGDWNEMSECFNCMFSLYRLGKNCKSEIAADMLAAKARAERNLGVTDAATTTLRFALDFVDSNDSGSRAGLLYDLGCSLLPPSQAKTEVEPRKLYGAMGSWSEALVLAEDLVQNPPDQPRYNYSEIAVACKKLVPWVKEEIAKFEIDLKKSADARGAISDLQVKHTIRTPQPHL